MLVTCLGLTLMHFGGAEQVFLKLFGDWLVEGARAANPALVDQLYIPARGHPYYEILGLAHWVAFCLLGYVVVPALYLKARGQSVIEGGYLRPGGFLRHAGIYALLGAPVVALVWGVSFLDEYQAIYPFYTKAGRSWFDLLTWELLYGLQFFALEFFFRGFMLDTLRKWVGYGAILFMLPPYVMIHFGKTWSESLAAVVAGAVLGALAIRYRSIWGGVMVHWIIAISMDVSALVQKGELPSRLWPPGW